MRPSIDQTMMGVADALAKRADCAKRNVGCVITDGQHRIIGTGYNGRPAGVPNCSEQMCDACDGVHAEINALLSCDSKWAYTAYVTHAPCWHCIKALANTSIQRIVYRDVTSFEERVYTFWTGLLRRKMESI